MRQIKLKKLSEDGDWIVCKDKEGWEWTVKRRVFEEFKFIGFPNMPNGTYEKLFKLTERLHYYSIPKVQRYELIKQLLEVATNTPLETIFPNL